MKPRNNPFLMFVLAAGLPACSGGAGAPPIAPATEPLTAATTEFDVDYSRVLHNVHQHVSSEGKISYNGSICDQSLRRHCKARMATDAEGHPIRPRPGGGGGGGGSSGPSGLAPADLQAAYGLDVTKTPDATIAIVDAYGYTTLESDLAAYRSYYKLPACTTANGCLKIVNEQGQTSPLPASDNGGCDNGWNGETSLDVDMASAACPNCKILVVLADDDDTSGTPNLEMSQATAGMLGATVISNSWGGPDTDTSDIMTSDKYFDLTPNKVGIFIAAGDDGWNNYEVPQNQGGPGPDFPSTSEFVIAVGGTTLKKSAGSTRGWTETAWADGGSSCSPVIATPTWQQGISTSCSFRAACDVAAVGDPNTGVATYCGGKWTSGPIGGTSVASPLTASIFALYGHGQNKGDFVYNNKTAWNDVTSGTNGSCGNIQCQAGTGWDGPTGLGTPNGKALGAIPPTDGQTTPDMAMPPDMATPPDMAEATGNGGSGGEGGGGSGGTGTGGNGGSGGSGGGDHGGAGGCSMSASSTASGGLWIFLVLGGAILGRTLRIRRRS